MMMACRWRSSIRIIIHGLKRDRKWVSFLLNHRLPNPHSLLCILLALKIFLWSSLLSWRLIELVKMISNRLWCRLAGSVSFIVVSFSFGWFSNHFACSPDSTFLFLQMHIFNFPLRNIHVYCMRFVGVSTE